MPVQRHKRRLLHLSLALSFGALPNQIGFQDLGALIARQPAVAQRWRTHVFASAPTLMQAAMFSFPRPLATAIPQPPVYALASIDPNAIGTAFGRQLLGDVSAPLQFPSVNRKNKGDALVGRPRRQISPREMTPDELVPRVETEAPFVEITAGHASLAESRPVLNENPTVDARVYFGSNLLGSPRERIQPWAHGVAPQI